MNCYRILWVLVAGLGSAAAGCGDNSKQCGSGTTDVDGVCTAGGAGQCTDGTILDPDTSSCVIDPDACQDGTVLVAGACVDPASVTPDLTEAVEPNGLGLLGEASAAPAGEIVIKPVGASFVFNGKIVPHQDLDGDGLLDADVDTYLVEVAGPTLVNASADGLHGLAGAFITVAAVDEGDPLAAWQRLAINLTGDASERQLYLPTAGVYAFAVTDSRTLFTGAPAGAVGGDADFEYYVTLSQLAATPTALTVTAGAATVSGSLAAGEVKLYTVATGDGITTAELDIPSELATESVLVIDSSGAATTIKGIADGGDANEPATVRALGFRTGGTALVVVDHEVNFASASLDFDLVISVGSAGTLSKTGGTVTQPAGEADFSVFFYDVATDLEITGMDLAFDVPVTGVVVDESFSIFANFTFHPTSGFQLAHTFTAYKGLLRHPTRGRYYFLVFDPDNDVATVGATSTYAPLAAPAVTFGTPLTNQAPNAFASNPFTYNAGTTPWQLFDATGTGTGNLTQVFLDPAETTRGDVGYGFGRLDTLASTCTSGAGVDACADVRPIFVQTNPATGATAGRILLDDVPFNGARNYLVTVNTATTAGATFGLAYQARAHTDLGAVVAGTPKTANDQVLQQTTETQRYLVRATAGHGLSISVTPDAGAPALDTRILRLNSNESARGPLVNNGGPGAVDSLQEIQSGAGWTAFTVTTANASTGGTFDLAVAASAPVTYTTAAGTTAFVDACTAGTAIAMNHLDEGNSVANLATPAGFAHFGFATPQLKLFANGFVSFDTATACAGVGTGCFFTNANIPLAAAPNALAAPFWDDLVLDSTGGACQLVSGSKLILQWRGIDFDTDEAVAFQLILDGADDSFEFVYAATHVPTGLRATVGLENSNGSAATKLGFNTAGTITPGASIKLTPN
ncbi:MAG: hypothetical protein H0X17_01355 [Deltaproteobacteria bacterium]|nr:hypothetical protein [Deltaproteobacteria bacterium]